MVVKVANHVRILRILSLYSLTNDFLCGNYIHKSRDLQVPSFRCCHLTYIHIVTPFISMKSIRIQLQMK